MRRYQADFIPCNALLHQGSCHSHAWKDFVAGMWLYSKIYGALYSISLFVLSPMSLLDSPVRAVTHFLKKTLVSATFLTVNGTVVKYGICLLRNAWGGGPPILHFIPALVGIVGSWSILLERPSRQRELVYYVIPQVLYLTWRLICIKKNPWPRQDPLGLSVVSVFLVGHPHVRIRERERLNIAVTMQDVGFPTRQMSVALLLVSSNECVALSVVIFERVVIV